MDVFTEWTQKARIGGQVIINGEERQIEEIIVYHRGREKWINIVTHDQEGHEIAVEAVKGEDQFALWHLLQGPQGLIAGASIPLFCKKCKIAEQGMAMATVKTAEGTETATVSYWVFSTGPDRRVAFEQWNGAFYCYIAETTPPQVSF